VVFGAGAIERLGELARELNSARCSSRIMVGCYRAMSTKQLATEKAGSRSFAFHDFEKIRSAAWSRTELLSFAAEDRSIIGSAAAARGLRQGINFILTNGGQMSDYRGYGRAGAADAADDRDSDDAGTGSEAQSYALISDAETHVKMACGDPKAAFRVALLDPALTVSQPRSITATSGFDAIAHASRLTSRPNAIRCRNSSRAKRGDCSSRTTSAC
jgi:alcohol dehydrogenase